MFREDIESDKVRIFELLTLLPSDEQRSVIDQIDFELDDGLDDYDIRSRQVETIFNYSHKLTEGFHMAEPQDDISSDDEQSESSCDHLPSGYFDSSPDICSNIGSPRVNHV